MITDSTNGKPYPPAPPPPARRLRFALWGALFASFLTCAGLFAYFGYEWTRTPAFETVDDLDLAAVARVQVLVINRPDGGPDVGELKGEPLTVPAADYEAVFAPLRRATPVSRERGIWLGRVMVLLADGRRQTIMLYRVGEGNDPARPPVLLFSIGRRQFEVGAVEKWLKPLVEVEARARGG